MHKLRAMLNSKLGKLLFWAIFPAAIYLSFGFIIKFVMVFVAQFFANPEAIIADPIFTAIYSVLFYGAMLAAIYFIPTKLFKFKITKQDLGLAKEFSWADIGLGILGFIVAMILAAIFTSIIAAIVPNFNINQAQKIGFMGLVKPYEFILAFICVVILPSIVEELIFRGIMYGELRKISVLWAVILVSVLFGAAHGQLNVAITTFAMSLVMCFTREKLTDSIWAGMVLHFIKNAIGFVIIFTMPGLWL